MTKSILITGSSSTPLIKKLGIKPGDVVLISNAPDEYFNRISPLPKDVEIKPSYKGNFSFVHVFVQDIKSMQRGLSTAAKHLVSNGMIWVSWPKKSSKVETDLNENKIRDFGLSIGLVDVKVCAVNEIWSGLKFVIPVSKRLIYYH